jgi:hypothetical protein
MSLGISNAWLKMISFTKWKLKNELPRKIYASASAYGVELVLVQKKTQQNHRVRSSFQLDLFMVLTEKVRTLIQR